MSEVIDVDRCRRAMQHLAIVGDPSAAPSAQHACQNEGGRPRHKLIEVAIQRISQDGTAAFRGKFLYIKNYASFGDQSEESPYGCCPRHGHIVFRIGRTTEGLAKGIILGPDHVYLLEAVRDAGSYKYRASGREFYDNLSKAIAERDTSEHDMLTADAWLGDQKVESHAPSGAAG